MIRIDITGNDHMQTYIIAHNGLRRQKIIKKTFGNLFKGEGCKIGTVGTSYQICNSKVLGYVLAISVGLTWQTG